MENLTNDKKKSSCAGNCALCSNKLAHEKTVVGQGITSKRVAVFLLLVVATFSSCISSERFVNPSARSTGTANEPGTRIQPYPKANYDYNEQVSKSIEKDFSND